MQAFNLNFFGVTMVLQSVEMRINQFGSLLFVKCLRARVRGVTNEDEGT